MQDFNPNIYRGIIVNNRDPRDAGRVKIHIPGIYPDRDDDDEEIKHEHLPWATPALSLYNSGGDNCKKSGRLDDEEYNYNKSGTGGIFTVPEIGNNVFVFFEQGNHQYPVYFAMNAKESDWLTQKMMAKDRIQLKIDQIKKFKEQFTPVEGKTGTDGEGWGDGAHVNPRMGIEGEGELGPYSDENKKGKDNADSEGQITLGGGKSVYDPIERMFSNKDKNGEEYKRRKLEDKIKRAESNNVTLDVKPLLDKEKVEGDIDRNKVPHKYGDDMDLPGGTGGTIEEPSDYNEDNDLYHLNRHITSFTTKGGTTIVVDNREGNENFYLIHKNYLFNVDENGSAKEFCGQNNVEDSDKRSPDYNGEKEDDELLDNTDKDIKANKEVGVAGKYKIHVLGNFVTYTKGNTFMQVDKNMQIDVNDSYGVRVRKGDYDIIIEGEEDDARDGKDLGVEDGKKKQFGDLNVSVKNGNIELYCAKNANIHVKEQCNLRVEGDMRTHVKKAYHLYVEGDYNQFIKGNKYITVKGDKGTEEKYSKNRKIEIGGFLETKIEGNNTCSASKHIRKGDFHISTGELRVDNDVHVNKNLRCKERLRVKALDCEGKIQAKGDIKSDKTIKAEKNVTICKVNLKKHKHKTKRARLRGRAGRKRIRGFAKPKKTTKPKGPGKCANVKLQKSLTPRPADKAEFKENKGAGETVKEPEVDSTKGSESKEKSPNKTVPAERRHEDRDPTKNPKSDVPVKE